MNVYLMGYRGSGKSCVARHLADELGWNWCDADAELERQAGQTIQQIFATQGELAFRDLECDIVAQLAQKQHWIVALGGGAVLREENRRTIARSGRTVWLRATPETLWQRIQGDATTTARRPNLTGMGGIDEVRHLLAQRTPIYEQCADLVVDTEGKTPTDIARTIATWLSTPHSGSSA